MKRTFLPLLMIVFSTIATQAQFPSFTDFQAKKYYHIQTKDATVKSYFTVFGLVDSVDSHSAYEFAGQALDSVDRYDSLKSAARDKKPMTAAWSDSAITYQEKQDYFQDAANYFRSINKFTGSPRFRAMVLPVWRKYESKFFYQNAPQLDSSGRTIDFLSNFVVQSNINKTAISSELMSGSVWILRLDVSTTVVDNSDTTNREKVNNKLAYGGLINGRVSWPLFYYVSKGIAMYFPLSFSASADNVGVNKEDTVKKSFYFTEWALSGYIRISISSTDYTMHSGPSIFVNGKIGYIDGGSNFYDKLESIRHGFWLARATVGMEFNKNVRIAASFPLYSSERKVSTNQVATIGIQVDPKILTGK